MRVFDTKNSALTGDVSAQNRIAHPQIRESDECLSTLFQDYIQHYGESLSVFNVGAGSGYLVKQFIDKYPDIQITAQEDHPIALKRLKNRVHGSRVKVLAGSFENWSDPVHIVLSEGAHHHLPRSYLQHAKRVLRPDGVLVISDEFCPEYCYGKYADRISNAAMLYLADGYILTQPEEIEAFEERKEIPGIARELETLRHRALWNWYRYVVDHAIELDFMDVVVAELRGARDDLNTSCADEFKLSPRITERELELAGFKMRSKYSVAPAEPPKRQSFFVYEYIIEQ